MHSSSALGPEQLKQLQGIFDEIILSRRMDAKSEDAETLAARLVSLYQSGIHDRDALRRMAGFLCLNLLTSGKASGPSQLALNHRRVD